MKLWTNLRGVSEPRAIINLAKQLEYVSNVDYLWLDAEVRKIDPTVPPTKRERSPSHAEEDEPEERIQRAAQKRTLVLVRGNGHNRLYWRGQWHKPGKAWARNLKIWELLCTAAIEAKRGRAVSWDQLSDRKNDGAITDRKARLRQFVPAELFEKIEPGSDVGSYRLRLKADEIEVIELRGEDYVWEPD